MGGLTQSYVHGTSATPLIGETIGVHFDIAAERFGDRDALIVRHQGIRWTYAELKERVDAFAAGLLALGLEPGDRIGIWSPNNSEWVVTQFATAKAGLILVNINPAYRLCELEYALNKVGCRALITRRALQDQRLYRNAARARAGDRRRARPAASMRAASGAAHRDPHRRRRDARLPRLRRRARMGRRPAPRSAGGAGGRPAVRRSDQHPVHLRHDRRCRRARRSRTTTS